MGQNSKTTNYIRMRSLSAQKLNRQFVDDSEEVRLKPRFRERAQSRQGQPYQRDLKPLAYDVPMILVNGEAKIDWMTRPSWNEDSCSLSNSSFNVLTTDCSS